MSKSIAASGSAHAYAVPNSKGEYRDGGKTCRITLPGPIPAGQFWSFMVYDGQHRSMLETDQQLAGLDSNQRGIKKMPTAWWTVWLAPKVPAGQESN